MPIISQKSVSQTIKKKKHIKKNEKEKKKEVAMVC